MMNRLLFVLPALAFALAAPAAHAQSQPPSKAQPPQPPSKAQPPRPAAAPQPAQGGGFLYKSTMPDGKVIYGDAPMPGAVKVEKTRPDTSKKGITAATPKEMAAGKKLDERAAGTGTDRVSQLDAALKRMEAQREKVREPLEGERIGNAGGGSRFTDAYLERQKAFDKGVENLRQELDKARSGK